MINEIAIALFENDARDAETDILLSYDECYKVAKQIFMMQFGNKVNPQTKFNKRLN